MNATRSTVSATRVGCGGTPDSWTRLSSRNRAAAALLACTVVIPPGCPSVPGLKKRQRFSAPHLSHDYAIRTETHCDADQPGQVGHIACVQLHGVPRLALELARVLEDHDSLRWIAERDDLAHEGVRERGLARRGPSGDENVLAVAHAVEKHLLLRRRHDPSFHVVLEPIDLARALPDHEGRRRGDRRQDSLETVAVGRQLPFDDR